jgi:hypothetical protein
MGDWKHALDNNEYLAAIRMDLSKAFDCLLHDLLLLKLNAYGLSKSFYHAFFYQQRWPAILQG